MQKSEKNEIWLEKTLKITVTSMLVSLGVVLSVLVVFIPNLEFISLTIFIVTLLFGLKFGMLAMISITIIYEFIVTPIYGAAGLLFIFKIMCYLLLVISVGKMRKLVLKLNWWELGTIGSLFSLFYDIVTTVAGQYVIIQRHMTVYYLITILVMGAPFTINHITTNFVLFSLSHIIIRWSFLAFEFKGIRSIWDEEIIETIIGQIQNGAKRKETKLISS